MEREATAVLRTALERRATTSPEIVADLDNDALILRLQFTVNHLSRWLTPIHDQRRLQRAVYRGDLSVKDLLRRLRGEELRVFPMMYAISVRPTPDLDRLAPAGGDVVVEHDEAETSPMEVMAEFRRLRQSTASLLRSLPDSAWELQGVSRRDRNWTIRGLAEHLAVNDDIILSEMDRVLDQLGVREGIATASRAHLNELPRFVPTRAG